MLTDTRFFPAVPAALPDQSLISHVGLGTVTSFLDAAGFGSRA